MIDIKKFAKGDGVADDTAAFQKAVDEAHETGESVYISSGRYICGEIFVKPEVYIKSDHSWGYRMDRAGKAVIAQKDENQACIFDMTNGNGATLDGLSLVGQGKGNCVGILSRKKDYGKEEDAYRIENCRVAHFGSHAVFLDFIWCFSVRHCMFAYSGGDGLAINGWDGFVIDNWFSGNGGAGFGSQGPNASVTMTGNRIEWNKRGGIVLEGGSHYNITGNYIDRSGSAAIILKGTSIVSCAGNVIYRSGKFEAGVSDSAHCIFEGCKGLTFTGNAMNAGRDDGGKGDWTPNYAMRLSGLTDCLVTSNVFHKGAMAGLIDDRGGHTNSVIENNLGSVHNLEG
ncbi:MAG: right-handed parallel beta-helix repeat-containing protein [Oscillospiraceae bacterium]|nr:right-handed parallel beta-helix repeat-containing protein [Oscillospiraceae bacterium]